MCIAILKTKKGKISDEALKNSFRHNSDGAGIAYTVNNNLVVEKGIFSEDELIKAVRKAEKICDNNMLIHCRIGTSGVNTEFNTHPFMINNKVCLIHNGILNIDVPKGSQKNDTQIFIDTYLSKINKKMLMHNGQLHKLIAEVIGKSNKFVLLDNKGYYKIINEKAGHWKDNVWYSNSTYESIKTTYVPYSHFWDYEDEYERYYNERYDGCWTDCKKKINVNDNPDLFYAIEDVIYSLKENDFDAIGDAPVYCHESGEIISVEDYSIEENGYIDLNCEYLYELSEELYDEYMDMYEEYIEAKKNLEIINNIDDGMVAF